MLLGPIFTVDVVKSARRRRHFLLRILYAGILLILFWISYESTFGFSWISTSTPVQQAARFAAAFFSSFSITQLLAVLVVGPALSATTIAAERERRTIEYLLATDLTNSEIVLSKFFARFLQVVMLVIAGAPVLSLAMLLGGISFEQILISVLITLSTAMLVGMLGIAISVSSPRVRDAIGRVYVILFALLVLPGIIIKPLMTAMGYGWQSQVYQWIAPLNEPLIEANPIGVLWRTLYANVMPGSYGVTSIWSSVGTMLAYHLAAAAALGGFSVWAVRRVHLRASGRGPKQRKVKVKSRRLFADPGEHPMLWKETVLDISGANLGVAARIGTILLILAILAPIGITFVSDTDGEVFHAIATGLATLLACAALIAIAARAANSITGEREKDTWLMLISTPLEDREIVTGKIFGSLLGQRGLLLVLGLIWALQIVRAPQAAVGVLFSFITIAILAFFAATLGTLFSLNSRSSTRAMAGALGVLVFVGGGYFFCCGMVLAGGSMDLILAPAIPFLIAFPNAVAANPHNQFESRMVAPYLIGTCGYLVAALALWAVCISNFETLSGRTTPLLDEPLRRPEEPAPESSG